MNEKANDTKVFSNLIWRFGQVFGGQAVSFIVSIILARILAPEVYGTLALVTVIITILQVFIDSGLCNALVQKKNADDLDFSSAFFFNMFVCISLYLLMFAGAPLIARFYRNDELVPIVRWISLSLVLFGVKGVQQAYVARNYLFKRMFFATIIGTVGGAVVGIAMAYMGYGVWALVGQMLFNSAADTAILWLTVKWKPRLIFSFERLKGLLSYSWKILVSSLLDSLQSNITALIIGRKYTESDLAYYNRGRQFPTLATYVFNSSMDSVLLATMSAEQDDTARVSHMTRRTVRVSSYVMWPVAVGLAVCAEPLIRLLLTDVWLPCVPYMQIFCITCAFQPIYTANLSALKSLGRSDLFLKLELIKKVLGLSLIVISMRWGILAMALSEVITMLIGHMINSVPSRRLLNYGYFQQLRDIMPSVLLSVAMGVVVWTVSLLGLSDILTLPLQILVGVLFYAVMSAVLKLDSFMYLLDITGRLLRRRKAA